MKSAIAMLVVVMGCGGVTGQTAQQMKEQTMTLPIPLTCDKPQQLYFDTKKGDLYVCEGGEWKKKLMEAGGDNCYHASDGTFHCYKDDVDKPKVAMGQTVCPDGQPVGCSISSRIPMSQWIQQSHTPEKPLKCGKYQHEVTEEMRDVHQGGISINHIIYTHCADDLHTVTEKEWQELMARLAQMEKQLRGEGGPTFTGGRP